MEEKNILQKVNESHEFLQQVNKGIFKPRDLKIPRKTKTSRSKRKKGYIGVLTVHENGSTSGEKVRLFEGTYQLKDETYHITDSTEILMWNGKFPFIIQPSWSKNPLSVRTEKPTNETYGQKMLIAKILKSVLVKKNKGGNILIWVAVIATIFIGYKLFTGGV